MIYQMELWHESFLKVQEGTKTVEMRLFDEKRSLIRKGDTITFFDIKTNDSVSCQVVGLFRYPSFEDLYQQYDKQCLGYHSFQNANPYDMLAYYSKQQIEKYGVLAIEIEVIRK